MSSQSFESQLLSKIPQFFNFFVKKNKQWYEYEWIMKWKNDIHIELISFSAVSLILPPLTGHGSFLHSLLSVSWSIQSNKHTQKTVTMSSSSSISCTKLTLFTITAITIQFIGLYLFVFAFFPVKPLLSGYR